MTTDADGVCVDETHKLNAYMVLLADPALLLFDALEQWAAGTGSIAQVRKASVAVREDMAAALTDGRTGFENDETISVILEACRDWRQAMDAGVGEPSA